MTKQKIEWQGGILNSATNTPLAIKNKNSNLNSVLLPEKEYKEKKITGRCSLRIEKKGRGGNPAIILFKFSDPEAKNLINLKKLCSELKTKLACGGTIQNGEILLTLDDTEKVKTILKNFFNIQI